MGNPNIVDRQFSFCPTIAHNELEHLVVECSSCTRFFAACCAHGSFGGDWYDDDKACCHHHQLVFTDGACSNNGRATAKVGLGIAVGDDKEYQWSISVHDAIDPGAPRTSQRAELLAAIAGLKKLHGLPRCKSDLESGPERQAKDFNLWPTYIVVTDSMYVVQGVTEWLPKWRKRGLQTSTGKTPVNLDLFLKLDKLVTSLEETRISVGFWHIPREYNQKADALAKHAAKA